MLENIIKVDLDSVTAKVMNTSAVKEFFKSAQENRLYFTGKDSEGKKLRTDASIMDNNNPFYSMLTVQIKKGLVKGFKSGDSRTANVTLTDSGKFYESLALKVNKSSAELSGDFDKSDGNIYKNFQLSYGSEKEFEDEILGLNEKQMEAFIEFIQPLIFLEYKKQIGL
ncbi:MAG: hypothetical protein GY870_09625 [archaeon]|nr:hypothetical protein [archaeon]